MNKTFALLAVAAFGLTSVSNAADTEWNYDFGTSTGTWSSGSSTNGFTPQPDVGGGNSFVRVGTGGGGFVLDEIPDFGTDSALIGIAPTGGSVNKFSIYSYDPGTAYSMSFDIRLSGGDSGQWLFFTGSGASFSNANAFTGNQSFTGLSLNFAADGAISLSNRAGASWAALTLTNGASIAQDTTYTLSFYGNNTAAAMDYVVGGVTNSLASNTYDLWVNGIVAAQGLSKAQLANVANIDSFMFYGLSSAGNVATLELDNITYANYLVPEPSTYALLAMSAMGLSGYIVRRRRK